MAVEARHHNHFPPQILRNRDTTLNGLESMSYATGNNGMMYGGLSAVAPVTGTTTSAAEMMLPVIGAPPPIAKNVRMKAETPESGVTSANPNVASRKRSREDSNNSINMNQLASYPSTLPNPNFNNPSSAGQFTFLGEDYSSQIQRQQLDVDAFIAQHTEKLRLEMEERKMRYTRGIKAALEEAILRKLKQKQDQINKIAKLNFALEERVKSLCVENQIWRDLAETNEATANVLRNNLEQVLAQVEDYNQQRHQNELAELVDDAQSCCGSNDNIKMGSLEETNFVGESSHNNENRLCRSCGKEEACVLLLPCRHLCLCSVCGSSQHICPVCRSTKNCSVHVNFSS